MASFRTVYSKELADHFGSKRFILLFILVIVLSTVSAYQGATAIKDNIQNMSSSGGRIFMGGIDFISIFSGSFGGGFSFMYLMYIFGPIIGLALGFDAINKERASGSLSVLLSQPIFRDSIINGKFLAGLTALSLMVVSTVGIMAGLAIPILGFGPSLAETTSIIVFTGLTILYLGFWLALSLLFSTAFKKTTTSIMATVSVWIFSTFAISVIASIIATALVPTPPVFVQMPGPNGTGITMQPSQFYMEASQNRYALQNAIQCISPSYLYTTAANTILSSMSGYSTLPITLGLNGNLGIISSWPQITAIGVAMVVCFGAAYLLFLRREIRAGG